MMRRRFAGKSLDIGASLERKAFLAQLAAIDPVEVAANQAAYKAEQDRITAAGVVRSRVEYANQDGAARKDRSAIMRIAHANARHIRTITPGTPWRDAMAQGLRNAWAHVPYAVAAVAKLAAIRAATAARVAERKAAEARAAEARAAKRDERAAAGRAARAAARAELAASATA